MDKDFGRCARRDKLDSGRGSSGLGTRWCPMCSLLLVRMCVRRDLGDKRVGDGDWGVGKNGSIGDLRKPEGRRSERSCEYDGGRCSRRVKGAGEACEAYRRRVDDLEAEVRQP